MSRIVVVSDTHSKVQNTRCAIAEFEEYDPVAIIHCGDICDPKIVGLFDRWPTHFVYGNNDFDRLNLRNAMEVSGHVCHGDFGSLVLEERKIAFLHSHDERLFEKTIRSGEYDLVFYGHTHVPDLQTIGSTQVVNPGALHRARAYTFAVVDLQTMTVQHVPVNV